MKQFLIKYRLKKGLEDGWHQEVTRFIEALEKDADLNGKISYRCMKNVKGSDYYHLATAVDDDAVKILQSRDFFANYTKQIELASDDEVEVLPLEIIAETKSLE